MITIEMLKNTISRSGFLYDIVETLNLQYSVDDYLENASDQEILLAFSQASSKRKDIANALHKYPLPNEYKLLGKYTGDNLNYHIHLGFYAAQLLASRAERYGKPFHNQKDILDFGCGTSRILRFLSQYCNGPQYYGSDVYKGVIDWGRDAFHDIVYIHQNYRPPLTNDYSEESFDVIYAWSIFSHFDEPLHWEWLTELHRLLRPNGMLICSVHGKIILDRIMNEKALRNRMAISIDKADDLYRVFIEKGFAFRSRYDHDELQKGGLDSNTFGLAYISDLYIRNRWSCLFDILSNEEGLIQKNQDLIVLQKKGGVGKN